MKAKARVCLRCGKVSKPEATHVCADYIKYLPVYLSPETIKSMEHDDEKREEILPDNRGI